MGLFKFLKEKLGSKKDEQKDMKITISSSMGKNYEHTRIIANAPTNPSSSHTIENTKSFFVSGRY